MYKAFEKWLNGVLEENMPIPGVALNFNLYEEADFCWSIQLIGASCFDEEEEDWCCEETFCSGENRFSWKQHAEWEEILDVSMIRQYISNGKYAEALKKRRSHCSWICRWRFGDSLSKIRKLKFQLIIRQKEPTIQINFLG